MSRLLFAQSISLRKFTRQISRACQIDVPRIPISGTNISRDVFGSQVRVSENRAICLLGLALRDLAQVSRRCDVFCFVRLLDKK